MRVTSASVELASWSTLLGEVQLTAGEFLLYLDPDQLDEPSSPGGQTRVVADRWSLRRLLEQELRAYGSHQAPMLVHVRIPEIRQGTDLPFDAQSYPRRILDVKVPPAALGEVRDLPPRGVEQLVTSASLPFRLAALARTLSGLAWPPPPETALLAVVRLIGHLGPELRRLLLPTCPPGAARRVLAAEEPLTVLGDLLEEWGLQGARHPDDIGLRAASEELSGLVSARRVRVPAGALTAGLPRLLLGAVQETQALPDLRRHLEELPAAGTDLPSWFAFADAWARLRWLLASMPPNPNTAVLAAEVWDRWAETDAVWQRWLTDNYATELSRGVLRLSSVHKVGPFLSTHVVETGSKVLLLVMDGLGVAQWQHIHAHLGRPALEDRRLLACLPSMTTVSRQAIFAGALPTSFPDTIDRTDAERVQWSAFWKGQGLSSAQIHYQRTDGADAASWEDPHLEAVACGIAVNAVDDLMHGVSVNGDHQFHSAVSTWLGGGFLERALDWAERQSAQVWVTADHGNLPCVGLGQTVPDEGVRVLGRGLRARIYTTQLQRENASLPGLKWTPACFPSSTGAPLFAPGRSYFRKSGGVITHGGLSLDEVVVPLARIG
jgi:hypothetical protein